MENTPIKTNYPALYTLITVFFFWGFIAAGNSIFIPFCKSYFSLDQFQSQLIDFAFYTAYYLGALILFAFGALNGKDLVGKWGYKKSIVYGLLFSAVGAGAMIIAVEANLYTGMLVGLFIVALGFSLQQTAANPFAILLGDPKTGASRVNLGGGINSFGTTIGPLVVAFALFGTTATVSDDQIAALPLDKVVILYVGVGLLFVAAAAMFWFSKKVPATIYDEPIEKAEKALKTLIIMTIFLILAFAPVFLSYKSDSAIAIERLETENKLLREAMVDPATANNSITANQDVTKNIQRNNDEIAAITHPLEQQRMLWLVVALVIVVWGLLYANGRAIKKPEGWGAMQYPQLVLGMIAIFMYVGVEVAIGSNLGELLKLPEFGSHPSSDISPYVSMYWGSLMIGRWAGAISVFNLSGTKRTIALIVVPLVAFGIILGVNTLTQKDMTPLYYYAFCVFIQIIAMFLCKDKPARTLLIFAMLGAIAIAIGLMTEGTVAIYAILAGGLACSIMWPAIFSLALLGLGKYTAQGSAFLIMMILGGGIIPPIQGKLSDLAGVGIQLSYIIPLLCFVYLIYYAVAVKGILKKQNIDVDEVVV